ncbi:unnamed protein product [Lampetra planeri]
MLLAWACGVRSRSRDVSTPGLGRSGSIPVCGTLCPVVHQELSLSDIGGLWCPGSASPSVAVQNTSPHCLVQGSRDPSILATESLSVLGLPWVCLNLNERTVRRADVSAGETKCVGNPTPPCRSKSFERRGSGADLRRRCQMSPKLKAVVGVKHGTSRALLVRPRGVCEAPSEAAGTAGDVGGAGQRLSSDVGRGHGIEVGPRARSRAQRANHGAGDARTSPWVESHRRGPVRATRSFLALPTHRSGYTERAATAEISFSSLEPGKS